MTRVEGTSAPADSGFTLVEMLVALALSSMLVLGVGGLFTFASQMRERIESAAATERALLDLGALVGQLVPIVPYVATAELADPTSVGFTLTRQVATDGTSVTTEVRLTPRSEDAEPRLAASVVGRARADLSLTTFDAAAIEYLVLDGPAEWRSADALAGNAPRSARLVLDRGVRRWLITLWTDSR